MSFQLASKTGLSLIVATALYLLPLSTVAQTAYHHGDSVTLGGNFGTQNVRKTFLGGAGGVIEGQGVNTVLPNGNRWIFSDLGFPATVRNDPVRGKVIFTPEDSTHYNATRRY
ncbi:MAG: hypothetical protein ABI411_18795, partial [Tahibacter sp.]